MTNNPEEKPRLLIVDDSKVIRLTARKILRDHFETFEAVDGENAWETLTTDEPFSLVVSDLTMPNLDGFGLLERIRASHLPHVRDIPVIIITGANDSEDIKERASRAGATDFIGKPFDSVHLLARTQAHANMQAASRSHMEETIALEEQARVDPLTRLANEQAFMERGYQQLSYAIRHRTSLSLVRISIDRYDELFKQHGKEATESVVRAVARVLASDIRLEDTAARTGTAHFALLLPGMSRGGIHNLADRIIRDISARTLKQGDARIRFSVSVGIVAPDIHAATRLDELLAIAGRRLEHATALGGNRIIDTDVDMKEVRPGDADESTGTPPPGSHAQRILARLASAELEVEEIEATVPGISIEEINITDPQGASIENRNAVATEANPETVAAGDKTDTLVTADTADAAAAATTGEPAEAPAPGDNPAQADDPAQAEAEPQEPPWAPPGRTGLFRRILRGIRRCWKRSQTAE